MHLMSLCLNYIYLLAYFSEMSRGPLDLPTPSFPFSSPAAWTNPSPRLHKAMFHMAEVTVFCSQEDSCRLLEAICPTQKRYWPMKPFRGLRPGRLLPSSMIGKTEGGQETKKFMC
jgi:hypothetical protein